MSEEGAVARTDALDRALSFLKRPLVIIAVVGLAVRLILAPLVTYTFDVTGWALIMENIQSGNGLYDLAGYYYSPPWGYFLAVMSDCWDYLLGVDVYGERVVEALSVEWYDWYFNATATTPEFNLLLKIPYMVLDLVAGYLVYWIVDDICGDRKKATLAFAVWFLCPFVISVGCIGGQFDSLPVVLTLLTYIFLRRGRYFCAGAMFSLAFLTKLFPAILVFVFLAYIYAKHRDDASGRWRPYAMAVAGFLVMLVAVLLPNIIEGNLGDCFSFITSRASNGMGGNTGVLAQYGTVVAYLAILAVSALLAYRLARGGTEDLDRKLMFYSLLTLTILFLYPAAPQYVLLLMPFLAMWYVLCDRSLWRPIVMLMVGTTVFSVASNFTLFLSAGEFTDLVSMSTVMSLVDWFQQPVFGLSKMGWLYYGGGVVQWISVVFVLYVLLSRWKTFARGGAAIKGGVSAAKAVLVRAWRFLFPEKLSPRRRDYLIFITAYAVACVFLYVIVRVCQIPSSVYDGYFPYAEAMADGVVPYTDKVFVYGDWNVWEYPPLAYLFILIPRLVGFTAAGYQAAFIFMTGVFFAIGLMCCEYLAKATGHRRFTVMLAYSVMMFLMFEFLADRFDIIPAVLTMAAVCLMMQRREPWAFAVLAVATLTKLYPVLFVPLFVIYMLAGGRRREAIRGLVVFVAIAAAVLLAFAAMGADPLAFTSYHEDRPLEIESLAASIISLADLVVDLGISTVYSFGSDNIVGDLPDAVASVMLLVMGLLMALLYVAYAYVAVTDRRAGGGPGEARRKAAVAMLLCLLVFVLFSTVFSGQYLVWLVPAVLVLLLISGDGEDSRLAFWVFVAAEVLTQMDFLVNFALRGQGEEMSAAGIVVVLARNAVMVLMLYAASRALAGKEPFPERRRPSVE